MSQYPSITNANGASGMDRTAASNDTSYRDGHTSSGSNAGSSAAGGGSSANKSARDKVLQMIRSMIMKGNAPVMVNDQYVLEDGVTYHKSTETSISLKSSYLSIEGVMFIYRNGKEPWTKETFTEAGKIFHTAIPVELRESIPKYLSGEIESWHTSSSSSKSTKPSHSSSSVKGHSSSSVKGSSSSSVVGSSSVQGSLTSSSKRTKPSESHSSSNRLSSGRSGEPISSELAGVFQREMKYVDRLSVLEAPSTFDLREVLDWEKASKESIIAPGIALDQSKQSKTPVSGKPIIVVPNGVSANITLYNVKKFLESGIFEHTSALIQSGVPKPTDVTVVREHPEAGNIEYMVVDSVLRFEQRHWDRVVAFFVDSNTWQFKGWPWNQDPAIIFSKCAGVYIYFDDIKIPPLVRSWNVKCFHLKKQQRHLDLLHSNHVWDHIHASIALQHAALLKAISDYNHSQKAKTEQQKRQQAEQSLDTSRDAGNRGDVVSSRQDGSDKDESRDETNGDAFNSSQISMLPTQTYED